MYGALGRDNGGRDDKMKKNAAFIALVETLRQKFLVPPGADTERSIPQRELDCRSMQFFTVRRAVTLASLDTPSGIRRLNGSEEILNSGNRKYTQSWGSYWQNELCGRASGLAYNSTRATIGKGHSFVLWKNGISDVGSIFLPLSAELALMSPKGLTIVERVLDQYGVSIL